jgi:chaperonin GroES
MKIRPLNDRILVQPILEKEVRKGGIIIPDSAKERPTEGRVKAVGDGKVGEDGKRIKPDVKVGDKVLYSKYGGTEIKIDGEDFLLMREDDILGIVES